MISIEKREITKCDITEIKSFKDLVKKEMKPFDLFELRGNKFLILSRMYACTDSSDIDIWGFLLMDFKSNKKIYIYFKDDNRI
jgi:hypothetical protein